MVEGSQRQRLANRDGNDKSGVGHFEALQGFRWQVPVDSDELSTGAPTLRPFGEIVKHALESG